MSFLIIEIAGLLLLAALCGAGLAYWWLRRQFEDVTAEYELLQQRTPSAAPPGESFEQLNGKLESLQRALGSLPAAGSELEPLRAQLASIERKLSSSAELSVDLETVLARIGTVERKVDALSASRPEPPAAVDLSSVHDRLSALEARLLELLERFPPPGAAPEAVSAPEPDEVLPEDAVTELEDEPTPLPEVPMPAAVVMESVRREEGRNLLTRAAFGEPDDIEIIKGIGPKLRELLHSIGVYYFWQIAAWTEDDIAFVDGLLESFQGRIERDEWVAQAIELAAQPGAAKPPPGEGRPAIPARHPQG